MEVIINGIEYIPKTTVKKILQKLDDPWRNMRWCAEYMDINYRTVQNWMSPAFQKKSKNPFPIYKVGGKIVSKQSLIDKWIYDQT